VIYLLRAEVVSNGDIKIHKHKLEPPINKGYKAETKLTYRGILEGKATQILKTRLNTFIYNGGIQDIIQFTGLGNIEIMCKQERLSTTEISLRIEMNNYLLSIRKIINNFEEKIYGVE